MSIRFLSLIVLLVVCVLALPATGRARLASYAEVRAVLAALADVLPPELKAAHDASSSTAWSTWAADHDRDIRRRLQRGDDDTIVNWLLLGTSFTARPRARLDSQAPTSGDQAKLGQLIAERLWDLVAALRQPGADERRLFARRLLEERGYRLDSEADRQTLERYLVSEVARVSGEASQYAHDLSEARRLGDASADFSARSRVFRTRGLSLDTSMLPSFALEQTLGELRKRGLLTSRRDWEVGVVGPGLDFSDKSAGYDFYPQQTLQPFALVDSLVRLGLADTATGVRVTTLDLSRRVNAHMTRARQRAAAGSPYVLRVPFDPDISWKPELVAYWKTVGDRIGAVLPTNAPVEGATLRVRTIRVRPQIVSRIQAEDLNMVVQRVEDRRFDLIVATNVFVYYDVLDQALALSNVESMLRPGAFLLSNNSLLELPESRLRSVGYLTTPYSDRQDDGDHVVWYRRLE